MWIVRERQSFTRLKFAAKPGALGVARVAVQPDADAGLGHPVHDRADRGQFAGRAVGLQRHLLAEAGGRGAQLFNARAICSIVCSRGRRVELVRKHAEHVAAHVVAELEMRLDASIAALSCSGCGQSIRSLQAMLLIRTGLSANRA